MIYENEIDIYFPIRGIGGLKSGTRYWNADPEYVQRTLIDVVTDSSESRIYDAFVNWHINEPLDRFQIFP